MEQLLKISTDKKEVIFLWGSHDTDGFYELDEIASWKQMNPGMKCILATRNVLPGFSAPKGIDVVYESLNMALLDIGQSLEGFDAYVAGPPSMMPSIMKSLLTKGIKHERIKVDSFSG